MWPLGAGAFRFQAETSLYFAQWSRYSYNPLLNVTVLSARGVPAPRVFLCLGDLLAARRDCPLDQRGLEGLERLAAPVLALADIDWRGQPAAASSGLLSQRHTVIDVMFISRATIVSGTSVSTGGGAAWGCRCRGRRVL